MITYNLELHCDAYNRLGQQCVNRVTAGPVGNVEGAREQVTIRALKHGWIVAPDGKALCARCQEKQFAGVQTIAQPTACLHGEQLAPAS